MALVIVASVGCAGVFAPVRPTTEPVTLRFAYPLDQQREPYERLAAEFRDIHPDITVEVIHIADMDYAASQESGVDVFETSQFDLPTLVERGAILDLDPILQEDPYGIAADLYPNVLNAFTWQGQIWAVPADIDPWVLYYNRDLFDQAGVPYPDPEWTWDDFLEKAALLTDDLGSHKQYGFASNPEEPLEIIAFIYQHGGTLVDSLVDPQAPMLNTSSTVEAVTWYADLALQYQVMMPPEVLQRYPRGGAYEAAIRGHVAMWVGPMSIRGGYLWNFEWPFNWGVAPLPQDEQRATLLHLSGYFISTYSPHPREAWLWIQTITGSPRLASNLPPRRSVAETPGYQQRVGPEMADVARASADYGLTSPPTPWLTSLIAWFGEALSSILNGEQTVEAAMEGVQRQAEMALDAQRLTQ
jgi:multiple sugar transport system substrate-binding protein